MAISGEYAPSPSKWVRDQVELYERTNGAEGNTILNLPVVIVTSKGNKSGKVRKTPLMRVEHNGDYLAVASQGGAPTHPVWFYNLTADPHCVVQDGPEKSERVARLLDGGEREIWWQRAVAAFPNYAQYQENTERVIPVFLLERASH